MSRTTPPTPTMPSGTPQDPKRQPGAGGTGTPGPAQGPGSAGMPAQRPNVTTPMAPPVGASAPPGVQGVPANKLPPVGRPGTAPALGKPAGPALGQPQGPALNRT